MVTADVLVLGGGGAGARAAIAVDDAGKRCILVSKGPLAHSGATPMACPSYQAAAAIEDPRDSEQVAFDDTRVEGRDLGDEHLIWALTSEATERALDLETYGVKFRKTGGSFYQVSHPGHSFPRNLVIKGCGYSMMFHLRRELRRRPGVRLMEDAFATKLIKRDGRVVGATVLDLATGEVLDVRAGAVIIATGGYPELWLRTDTTPELTGDGQALAFQAGAELVDLEMMLYYPTCLTTPAEIAGTLVQHEGLVEPTLCDGAFLNGQGNKFLPPGRLPVRDVMIRLIFREIDEGRATPSGGVYIDLRSSSRSTAELRRLLRRLDSLPYHNLADLGVDIATEPIEVAPATHYTLGGIRIDDWGRTSVPGLYACGEAAGNVHGANRTSGNALSETQVFGRRAGIAASEEADRVQLRPEGSDEVVEERDRIRLLMSAPDPDAGSVRPRVVKDAVKQIMHRHLGHERDEAGMETALAELHDVQVQLLPRSRAVRGDVFNYELQEALEAEVMVEVAQLVTRAAMARKESRGHHFRTDHPEGSPGPQEHTLVRRADDGGVVVGDAPVVRLPARPHGNEARRVL